MFDKQMISNDNDDFLKNRLRGLKLKEDFFKKIYSINAFWLFNRYCSVDDNDKPIAFSNKKLIYFLDTIKKDYKLLVLNYNEALEYSKYLEWTLNYCTKINLPIFLLSTNPVNQIFFDKVYKHKIFCNNPSYCFYNFSLFTYDSRLQSHSVKRFNLISKNIKILFLNFNRAINRDYIISELNRRNELYNSQNFISFYNHIQIFTDSTSFLDEEKLKYELSNFLYAREYQIDFDFLRNLKLIPDKNYVGPDGLFQKSTDEHLNSHFDLYNRSKFNIICEYHNGYSKDTFSYDYYDLDLTLKTILPLLFKNVFYLHDYNKLLTNCLRDLGFYIFFEEIDSFFKNINDEYYYSSRTQEMLEHNHKLCLYLIENSRINLANQLNDILEYKL